MTTTDSVKYRILNLIRMLYSFCARLACLSFFRNHGIANPCALRSMLLFFAFVDFVHVSSNSSRRLSNDDVKAFYPFLYNLTCDSWLLPYLGQILLRFEQAFPDQNPIEGHMLCFLHNKCQNKVISCI